MPSSPGDPKHATSCESPDAMNTRIGTTPADEAHPEPNDMYRAIGDLLRTVRTDLLSSLDRELAEHRISGAQHAILAALAEDGIDSAANLCRAMSYDPGAMTRMLDRLERKGLVHRARCRKDRRVVRLELTDEGQRLCRDIPYNLSRVLNSMLRGFTAEEVEIFKGLTRRMLANAEAR